MIESLLTRFGAIAVFASASVECDATLVIAGVLAHVGIISLPAAIVAGALGQLAGDSVWYAIGRRGSAAIRDTETYRKVGPTVERLAARFGPFQILAARLVLGTRNASMLFWGTQRLPYGRFLAIDAVGATLWALVLVPLGWMFSTNAEVLLGRVHAFETWLLAAAVTAIVVAIVARRVLRRRAANALASERIPERR